MEKIILWLGAETKVNLKPKLKMKISRKLCEIEIGSMRFSSENYYKKFIRNPVKARFFHKNLCNIF